MAESQVAGFECTAIFRTSVCDFLQSHTKTGQFPLHFSQRASCLHLHPLPIVSVFSAPVSSKWRQAI